MKTDNSEDEMIISRILFLCTYDTTMDFDKLIKQHSMGDNVNYVRSLGDYHAYPLLTHGSKLRDMRSNSQRMGKRRRLS